jgi:hypothetical protein
MKINENQSKSKQNKTKQMKAQGHQPLGGALRAPGYNNKHRHKIEQNSKATNSLGEACEHPVHVIAIN